MRGSATESSLPLRFLFPLSLFFFFRFCLGLVLGSLYLRFLLLILVFASVLP